MHPYLTWRDFNYWIIELLEYQKGRDWYWDMLRVFSGKFDLPETYVDASAIWKKTRARTSHRLARTSPPAARIAP